MLSEGMQLPDLFALHIYQIDNIFAHNLHAIICPLNLSLRWGHHEIKAISVQK